MFELLFAEQARLGRLFALRPPLVDIRPGDSFEVGLTLFGAASEHAPACAQALAGLGDAGLGRAGGRFALMYACIQGPEGAFPPFLDSRTGLHDWPAALSASAWLDVPVRPITAVQLAMTTPLRIKENNRPLRGPFSFTQLVRRMHGRLAQLAQSAGEANPLALATAEQQLAAAERVHLVQDALCWQSIKRRSARSGQSMAFGGVSGTLLYRGDLTPFAGLLALAGITQLGGKTAFGFGCLDSEFFIEESLSCL
ncbi:MAG: CRISPR system precrRNA processing endoribonuclease RAMP protein Cas6 [Rhodocyclaceae bacterium]|nr:CRISPR system precrRNA processing endoribonuclease RAMP protein Cas6 [Rhodocyclaceae bacterium]